MKGIPGITGDQGLKGKAGTPGKIGLPGISVMLNVYTYIIIIYYLRYKI